MYRIPGSGRNKDIPPMTALRKSVSAAILYDSLPAPGRIAIRKAVNAGLAVFGLVFDEVAPEGRELIALATDAGLRIAVTPLAAPVPAELLAPALTSRFTRARPGDYLSPVTAHRAALLVSSSDARQDAPDPMPDDTLIVTCHAAVAALVARTLPLALHWQPTDMLYLPHEIPALRGIGFPVALATRPELFTARPDSRGRPRRGILAAQSERYFGKPVRVEPTTHPLPECLAVIDYCILRKLCGEDLLARDATILLPGRIEAAVRHVAPDAALPLGAISLTLRAPLPTERPALPDDALFRPRPVTGAPAARLTPKGRRVN